MHRKLLVALADIDIDWRDAWGDALLGLPCDALLVIVEGKHEYASNGK